MPTLKNMEFQKKTLILIDKNGLQQFPLNIMVLTMSKQPCRCDDTHVGMLLDGLSCATQRISCRPDRRFSADNMCGRH